MDSTYSDDGQVTVPKVLVIILNKDNADGLREALRSLISQAGGCTICECFEILVMDGGSNDRSEDVVREFGSRYPCIEFRVQRFRGGVGPARIEAVRYALERGYDYILWGDSENVYLDGYVDGMLSTASNCDVTSGKPVLKCSDVASKLFYWYHAYHVLFKYVRRTHAPGNNKLVKTEVYAKSIYPPVVRSDDFYFSIIALRRGVKYCYNSKALVEVKLPSSWRDIKSWQRMRLLGSVQGAKLLGMRIPPDFIPWLALALYPFYVLAAIYLALVPATYSLGLTLLALASLVPAFLLVKLHLLSKEVCLNHSMVNALFGILGMYVHSLFTTYYTVLFTAKYLRRDARTRLFKYFEEVDRAYGVSAILGLPVRGGRVAAGKDL